MPRRKRKTKEQIVRAAFLEVLDDLERTHGLLKTAQFLVTVGKELHELAAGQIIDEINVAADAKKRHFPQG